MTTESTMNCSDPVYGSHTVLLNRNDSHVIFRCEQYYQLEKGNLVRVCLNGSWGGLTPVCEEEAALSKEVIVGLVVGVIISVFVSWAMIDFCRFRSKRREIRERKGGRADFVGRVDTYHAAISPEIPVDDAMEKKPINARAKLTVWSKIVRFFSVAPKPASSASVEHSINEKSGDIDISPSTETAHVTIGEESEQDAVPFTVMKKHEATVEEEVVEIGASTSSLSKSDGSACSSTKLTAVEETEHKSSRKHPVTSSLKKN